jgi:hypothetical protein
MIIVDYEGYEVDVPTVEGFGRAVWLNGVSEICYVSEDGTIFISDELLSDPNAFGELWIDIRSGEDAILTAGKPHLVPWID